MEVVLSQFKKSLIASGLMTSDEVEAFIEKLPSEKSPEDGKTLAQELVRHKKLTKFQAQAIYQGKTKGLTLGDYVVLDRIGQGGMGQVFKAKHKVMDRVVALKTLPAAATSSELVVQRFHREVQVAARLSHPNIVTAHDAGESRGLHYLVMECVEGDDLGATVKQRGRLPINKVIDYILQAAMGLEYAHKQKVIHRDIKPSNLLLDKDGTVKILDMGLARLNEAIGPEDQTAQETLTGTGQVMGTIDFMPPEQAENTKQADERSDIYSLGCTLYYLVTGQPIYSGDTVVMKIVAHRERPIPSLREELPEVSQQLDAVYQKMVAKKPDDRYASMTEVIAELEKCAAPPEKVPETATFEGFSLKGTAASEQTLNLDMPVISPVDEFRRGQPKKASKVKLEKNHIIYGSVAVGVLLILGLLGVVFSMRTPEGTLIVEVNQPDAEISVDDGKVTLKSPSDSEPVEVEVDEGKHTLKITKGGFHTFAREFEITSGGEEVIRVALVPLEKEVVAKPVSKLASKPVAASSSGGNWALEFDGESSGVHVSNLEYDGSHPLTLEATVVPQPHVDSRIIGFKHIGLLSIANSSFWQATVNTDFHYQISQKNTTKGGVIHLACVFDGPKLELYVEGRRSPAPIKRITDEAEELLNENEMIAGTLIVGNTGFCIGSRLNTDYFFHGTIHEVRISNIARYTEDFTPQRRFEPDKHTMALYHFDEGSGDVLHDASGNGHDGKIVGAKWVKVDEELGVANAVSKGPVALPNGWTFGEPVNLGPTVNTSFTDANPALSSDCLTLFFDSDRSGGQGHSDIWMSTRESTEVLFGEPVNLGAPINTGAAEGSPDLSSDGLILFWNSNRPGSQVADLWMATRKSMNDPFGDPINLGPNVNSEYGDEAPAISADSLTLLFRSDRPGGQGDYDVWMSIRKSVSDSFGKPVNLGQLVNTSSREGFPTLSSDGLTLLLYSRRSGGLGDMDLYVSTRNWISAPFGEPVNLGSPVNSPAWEGCPELSSDDQTLFFTSNRPGGEGGHDLWMAPIYRPNKTTPTQSTAPPLAVATDPDRRAAEWVLSMGGGLSISPGGRISKIDDLPDEPFVVTYIGVSDNQAVNDAALSHIRGLSRLRHLGLEKTGITDKGLEIVGSLSGLQGLHAAYTGVSDKGLSYLSQLTALESLFLHHTDVTGEGLGHLSNLKLEVLDINGIPLGQEGMEALACIDTLFALNIGAPNPADLRLDRIGELPSVKCLGVHCSEFGDSDITPLLKLKHLKVLGLVGTKITEAGLASLRESLPNCEISTEAKAWDKGQWRLRSSAESSDSPDPLAIADDPERRAAEWVLGIGGQLVLEDIGEISDASKLPAEPFRVRDIMLTDIKQVDDVGLRNLEGLSHLSDLQLGNTSITDDGLKSIGAISSIRSLNIGVTKVSNAGLPYLKRLTSLEQLTLQFTEVTAEGLRHLADVPGLWSLQIYAIPLGQAGMEALAEVDGLVALFIGLRDDPSKLGLDHLGQLKNLKCLGIGGSEVGDADIGPLLELKNLKVLYLGDTPVTKTGLAALRKSLPDCKILTESKAWYDEYRNFRPSDQPSELSDSPSLANPPNPPTEPAPESPDTTPNPPVESTEPTSTSEAKPETNEGDKTPKISWKLRHTLKGHMDEVKSVAFHPKGQMVLSGGTEDRTIRFWNVDSGKVVRSIRVVDGNLRTVVISPDGETLAASGGFGAPRFWNFATGQPLTRMRLPDCQWSVGLSWSPLGSALAWTTNGDAGVVNLLTGRSGTLKHSGAISIAFSPDGRLLASVGGIGKTVRLWNAATGMQTASLSGHDLEEGVWTVAFSPDGDLLATGGYDRTVKLWNLRTREVHDTLPHGGAVLTVAFNPAGTILASGGYIDRAGILLWDIATGEILAKLMGHEEGVQALAFSPDGKLLASGSADKTVRIWEIEMEQE